MGESPTRLLAVIVEAMGILKVLRARESLLAGAERVRKDDSLTSQWESSRLPSTERRLNQTPYSYS